MAKMTKKQFEAIMKEAGLDLKLYGWEGVLNCISIAQDYMAEDCEKKGFPEVAKTYRVQADTIYKALDLIQYYDRK